MDATDIRASRDWVYNQIERLIWTDTPAFFQLVDRAKSMFRQPDEETKKKFIEIGLLDQDGTMPTAVRRNIRMIVD